MTIKEVLKRAQERWSKPKRIPLPDVELIPASRLEEPLKGDRVADRWNIRHGGMVG